MINNNYRNEKLSSYLSSQEKPIPLYSTNKKVIQDLFNSVAENTSKESSILSQDSPLQEFPGIKNKTTLIDKEEPLLWDFSDKSESVEKTISKPTSARIPSIFISSIINYVSQFSSPGKMTFIDGKTGVDSEGNLISCANDFKMQKKLQDLANETPYHLDKENLDLIEAEINTNSDFDGFILELDGERILFGSNPKKTENIRQAIHYLLDKLDNEGFWQEEGGILEVLKKTHELLFDQISTDLNVGQFRTDGNMLVYRNADRPDDISGLPDLLRKHGGTKKDLEVLNKFLLKISATCGFGDLLETLTSEEFEALNKIAFIPPTRRKLADCLHKFETEFKILYKKMREDGKIDYIKLAAFAHQKITAIHPFRDGNGRVARTVMNSLLVQGGLCPVVFLNNEIYTDNIRLAEEYSSIDLFANYLNWCIESTKKSFTRTLRTAEMSIVPEDPTGIPIHSQYPPNELSQLDL